ncbi:MAG: DUF2911 domain-containing protein [Bacteroidia bacterium]
MKNLQMLTTILLTAILLFGMEAFGQKIPAVDKSPADISYLRKDKETVAKVVYSRPMKNGREIFGGIVPFEKVWRTGANEATEIKFFKDVTFGGQMVKAGTYSLFSIPGDAKWTIILNSGLDQWGAYSYKDDLDVVRVEGTVSQGDEVEAMAILFHENTLIIAWDKTRVSVPVAFE